MATVTRRKSTRQTNQAEPELKTTWVWDRSKRSWVEIVEKPADEELPEVNGATAKRPAVESLSSGSPVSLGRKVKWPKFLAAGSSGVRALNMFAQRNKAKQVSEPNTDVDGVPGNEVTRIMSEVSQETEQLARMAMVTVKEQASVALMKATEKAREIREIAGRETPFAKLEIDSSSPYPIEVGEQPVQDQDRAAPAITQAEAEECARARAERLATQEQERAETTAEGIIVRAEENARARADQIVARAREKAKAAEQDFIARAEENARLHAERTAKQAQETARAKEQDITARTEENAKALAEHIVSQAQERAEGTVQDIVARAEGNARARADNIVARAQERAEAEAADIVARTEDLCQQKLSRAERESQLMLEAADSKAREINLTVESTDSVVPVPPPAPPQEVSRPQVDRHPQERPVPYEGIAELVIEPPVDLRKMQKMLERLKSSQKVSVLDLGGSAGKGISIKLFSRNLAILPGILEALPEVDQVSDLPNRLSKICRGQRICPGRGGGKPAKRMLMKMRKRNNYLDI